MFTFDATPVKFIGLLVLFAWSTVWSCYELSRRQNGVQRVSNVLHILMSVVMLLMISGVTWKAMTAAVPTWALAAIFVLATCWFVLRILAANSDGDKAGVRHFAGHSMMFGAMVWHLAAMAVMSNAMTQMASAGAGMDHGSHDMSMGGSDMSMGGSTGMDPMAAMQAQGGSMWWFAVVGLVFMTYLVVASVVALIRIFDNKGTGISEMAACCAEVRPAGSLKYRLAASSDFAMNFGMFWMSTGLLVPLLPFFSALSF